MPSEVIPNDAMSNLGYLAIIPATTALTLRVKTCLCDSQQRGPRHLSVDRFILIVNNLLAFSLFVIWSMLLSGSSAGHLERLVVVDLLVVVHAQHYLFRLLMRNVQSRYHEPGQLALIYRKRRTKLSVLITLISCSACAALSAALEQYYPGSSHAIDLDYTFVVATLPMLHAGIRSLVLDSNSCVSSRQSSTDEATAEVEITTTNSFTITDEDDDDSDSLAETDAAQQDAPTSAYCASSEAAATEESHHGEPGAGRQHMQS